MRSSGRIDLTQILPTRGTYSQRHRITVPRNDKEVYASEEPNARLTKLSLSSRREMTANQSILETASTSFQQRNTGIHTYRTKWTRTYMVRSTTNDAHVIPIAGDKCNEIAFYVLPLAKLVSVKNTVRNRYHGRRRSFGRTSFTE